MVQGTNFSVAQRANCAHYLRQLFGDLDTEQIDGILAIVGTQPLAAAEALFAQGDAPGAFYVVLSGRLRAIFTKPDGTQTVLGDVAAGEPVGEIAMLAKEPRMASVVAVRPTLLLRITEENYLQLIRRFPSLALSLNQFFVRRLRQNDAASHLKSAPRNVAVVDLCESTDVARWTAQALAQFHAMDTPTQVVRRPADPADLADALNFEAVEQQGGLNLLVCDPVADTWTRSCLTYADLVVLAFDFASDPSLRAIERDLALYADQLLGKRIYLLLMHPADSPPPTGTARWLEPRRVQLHLHIRQDHPRDLRRFCRILTHRAVGLVLSGGGAKGCGHLGAVAAMQEDGLEFDFIGGTSAGALFGSAMSLFDFDWEKLTEIFGVLAKMGPTNRDYTWPILSLMSGRKMRAALTHLLEDHDLEDFWTTFYCISSNYSTAALAVHDRGGARRRVEASIAIPGVFPPVLLNGHLHVDGGLFDNLPILTMLERPVSHVVAVSLQSHAPSSHDMEEMPSSRQLLWDRVARRKKFTLPSLPTLLIHSLSLNSEHQLSASIAHADLYVRLDLRETSLLDWARWERTRRLGYEQTQAVLADLPLEKKFWRGRDGSPSRP